MAIVRYTITDLFDPTELLFPIKLEIIEDANATTTIQPGVIDAINTNTDAYLDEGPARPDSPLSFYVRHPLSTLLTA